MRKICASFGLLVVFLFCCLAIDAHTIELDGVPVREGIEHETPVDEPASGAVIQPWKPSWNVNQWFSDVEPLCDTSSSIGDFPEDLFTREQRQQGAIALHIFAAFYFFTLLAIVCNDYFLPSVECICEDLKITPDVAAATFMAVSGAIPEFFTNMISTFITESPMGLGAVIGTLYFNTLGVAACAGIATKKPVQLLWYPLARDCLIFSISVSLLTAMSWDGLIQWYEGLILSIGYIVYWLVLFQNNRIKSVVDRLKLGRWWCCVNNTYDLDHTNTTATKHEPTEWWTGESDLDHKPIDAPLGSLRRMSIRLQYASMPSVEELQQSSADIEAKASTEKVSQKSLWKMPKHSVMAVIWWLYTWPIRAITTALIPNPKTNRPWYPLTFALCIGFIGVNSYLIFWMMVVMGDTFGIPEVVMGLTILCWGSCLPEAIACIIVIRSGSGGVGVSNSLGSNSMAILFSLGVPWFLRAIVDGGWTTASSAINIYSHGISYIICGILFAILSLFVILSLFKYRLKKTIGLVLLLAYGVFLSLSLLLELNIIFPDPNAC